MKRVDLDFSGTISLAIIVFAAGNGGLQQFNTLDEDETSKNTWIVEG